VSAGNPIVTGVARARYVRSSGHLMLGMASPLVMGKPPKIFIRFDSDHNEPETRDSYYYYCVDCLISFNPFGALTLLFRRQESHPACKTLFLQSALPLMGARA